MVLGDEDDVPGSHRFGSGHPLIRVEFLGVEISGIEHVLRLVGHLMRFHFFGAVLRHRPVDDPVEKGTGSKVDEHADLVIVPDKLLRRRKSEAVAWERAGGKIVSPRAVAE